MLACSSPQPEPEAETAADSGPVFLVSQKGASTVAFYTGEGELLAETEVELHPHEIAWSRDGKYVYTTDNGTMAIEIEGNGGNSMSIIDVAKRERVGVVDLGEYYRPHGIAVDPKTGNVLISTENPDMLLVVDPVAKQVIKKYPTGGEVSHIVAITPDGAKAYVSNIATATISVTTLETGDLKLIETAPRPEGSCMNKAGTRLYVVHRDGDQIAVVDTEKDEIIQTIETSAGPVRCGLSGDEKTVVYGLHKGEGAGFADVESGQEVATVKFNGPSVSMHISPDGELATTAVQDTDTVYVLDIATRSIASEFKVKEGAAPDPVIILPETD